MLPGIHFFVSSALSSHLADNYSQALVFGVISHFVLDKLPHLDVNIFGKKDVLFEKKDLRAWLLVITEFSFFLLLSFYFIGNFDLNKQKIIFLGGIGGILPDILSVVFRKSNLKIIKIYQDFHQNWQYQFTKTKKNIFTALAIELLIFFFALILFWYNR